ncbi:MAG: hypothetical protein JNM59_02100 [Hyphomonadaceae bacterium]|nr:hypothetical protein [Hyphomonadaceae bacterium]
MRIQAQLMAAALVLAACGQNADKGEAPPAAPEAPNAISLSIEAGRYGVMLSQIHSLTADRSGAGEADNSDPREIARRLREAVWEYNLERSSLCGRGLFADLSCGPAFMPVWLGEPSDVAPTLEELQTRSGAVGEEVMRFWNAVCADARIRETDEEARDYVCAIE